MPKLSPFSCSHHNPLPFLALSLDYFYFQCLRKSIFNDKEGNNGIVHALQRFHANDTRLMQFGPFFIQSKQDELLIVHKLFHPKVPIRK